MTFSISPATIVAVAAALFVVLLLLSSITTTVNTILSAAEFVVASREFLELLLPYLMRSLPDWRSLHADLESS